LTIPEVIPALLAALILSDYRAIVNYYSVIQLPLR